MRRIAGGTKDGVTSALALALALARVHVALIPELIYKNPEVYLVQSQGKIVVGNHGGHYIKKKGQA